MSPSTQSKSTSVFHALGSYADRTKDAHGRTIVANGSATSSPAAVLSSLSSPIPGTSPMPPTSPSKATTALTPADDDDDDSWETVRSSRQKSRVERNTEEKRGSNSRNWRERDEKSKVPTEDKEDARSRSTKKESRPTSSTSSIQGSAPPSRATSAAPSKPAWGGSTTGQASVSPSLPVSASTSTAVPASSSINGSAEPTAVNGQASAASSDSTIKGHASDEGSWRARPKAEEKPTAPVVPKQAAPPPAVNAWDLRKKQNAASSHSARPLATVPLQFGTVTPAVSGSGETKLASEAIPSEVAKPTKKKKKDAAPPPVSDVHMWPDVNAAKGDEKKSKQEKKSGSETAPSVEEQPASTAAGKKAKWTPIPAAELQEAADKAAETSRQRKAKRGPKDESESKGQRGKKGNSDKKAAIRTHRSGSQSEPSHPRMNGSAVRYNGSEAEEAPGSGDFANGAASAPMSRAGSSLSKRSPGGTQLPLSPEQSGRDEHKAASGNTHQHNFGGSATLPRPSRGRDRDGRGYGGRGRGGYRSVSQATGGGRYDLSPLQGNAELAHIYSRGYGMGYSYYPMPPAGFVMPVDPSHATYPGMPMYARGTLPPPPLPLTQIPNLDPLRYWVLGQVEYYFSMQNLAMDFFLRQQMDLEGWIDVSMIASFNRIKSLTPDVAIVREVMEMSSLLEVKGDKVRLGGGEAKRWVLPDAKPSNIQGSGSTTTSPKKSSEATEISHGLPPSVDTGVSALGIENMIPVSPPTKFDVENALMKSSGSANVSSTASVLASDDAKTMTPATSIAGDTNASDNDDAPKDN